MMKWLREVNANFHSERERVKSEMFVDFALVFFYRFVNGPDFSYLFFLLVYSWIFLIKQLDLIKVTIFYTFYRFLFHLKNK
jgi:hypothetical protein